MGHLEIYLLVNSNLLKKRCFKTSKLVNGFENNNELSHNDEQGFEVMEARNIFDLDLTRIKILLHENLIYMHL